MPNLSTSAGIPSPARTAPGRPGRRGSIERTVRDRADDATIEALSAPIEPWFEFERLDLLVIDGSGRARRAWFGVTTDSATGVVLDVSCELNA